jgi:hypothetical protein
MPSTECNQRISFSGRHVRKIKKASGDFHGLFFTPDATRRVSVRKGINLLEHPFCGPRPPSAGVAKIKKFRER